VSDIRVATTIPARSGSGILLIGVSA